MIASNDDSDESRIATAISWARQFPGVPQNLTPADAVIHQRTITQQTRKVAPME